MRALLLLVLMTSTAFADELAALAPAADARHAVALGPAGQTYVADGKGGWVRTHAGGIAGVLTGAAAAGATVIAEAKGEPPFKLVGDAWTAIYVGQHAKAQLGSGPRPTAVVGKTVYALDRSPPQKLPDAPGLVLAVGASSKGVVIETDKGLLRLEGAAWKPIKNAPRRVTALVTDRWALVEHGIADLRTGKTVALPANLKVVAVSAIDDDNLALVTHGSPLELVTVHGGKVAREPIGLPPSAAVVGVAADRAGHVVVAVKDGRLAVKDGKTWTIATVRDELPADHPGPAPATSK